MAASSYFETLSQNITTWWLKVNLADAEADWVWIPFPTYCCATLGRSLHLSEFTVFPCSKYSDNTLGFTKGLTQELEIRYRKHLL